MSIIYKFEPLQPAIQDHTAYWDGIFTDEQLKQINALPQWQTAKSALVGGEQFAQNPESRISNVSWIDFNKDTKYIWDGLGTVIQHLNNQYFHFDLDGFYEVVQLGIYDGEVGGHYNWHIDAIPTGVPRKLSISLLLSDTSEFEGGQLQVKTSTDDPITLEQKKGRAWVFPSVFLHRVTPVTKGTRRSLVAWSGGKAFK